MDQQKIGLEATERKPYNSVENTEAGPTEHSETKETTEVSREQETKRTDQAAELRQIGGIVSNIQSQGDDATSGQQPATAQVLDIPGNTPEEKILHLLNDFPVAKAKEVINELEDPQHFGESHVS